MNLRSFLVTFLFFLTADVTYGQSYGLGFESFDVVQDKRTGLDLNPGDKFCFNNDFELSFELSFLANKINYFGYIFRMIEDDKRNIDLLYDNSAVGSDRFKLVIGDKFSRIAFDIPAKDLFNKWNRIRLLFSKSDQSITVLYGTQRLTQQVTFNPAGCYKVLFGVNQYREFKTTDVPPMKIRNVSLGEAAKPGYNWNLNETGGDTAVENKKGRHGRVINPLWIKKMHHDWQPVGTVTLNGLAGVAFDPKKGIAYVVGKDSLMIYNTFSGSRQSVRYASGTQPFLSNSQVLFDSIHNKLFCIYINEKQVAEFDFQTATWDKTDIAPSAKTYFLQANKFYSPKDSSLYILGGYGHLAYRNLVQQYSVNNKSWEIIPRTDSLFTPRYLAALAPVANGAYILGGYGSSTGQQMLNPRNWYDLLFFDTGTKSFKKIYELKIPNEDFVFANSMIVDEASNTFTALVFPKHKFNSSLQLMQGSLTRPEYKFVGSKIPYQFIDTESFADLFFDSVNNRYVVAALFRSDGKTTVRLFSLYGPPLATKDFVTVPKSETGWFSYVVACFLIGLILWFLAQGRRKNSKPEVISAQPETGVGEILGPVLTGTIENKSDKTEEERIMPAQNSILLFGNMQLFDENGNELTKLFTPLVKELFLVILLFSTRREGISSEKLRELLWFDKPLESARNNRAVNIAKLKGILDKMKHCQVSKETGYWKINIDFNHLRFDYSDYLSLVGDKRMLNKGEITQLISITKRGSFLADMDYEWLDIFKSEISNEIVDAYLRYAGAVKIADDAEFLVQVANYIFYFDPVNEEAMIIKCKALAHLGKHSLAKATFENFAKEYSRIYGEEFHKDMPEVLHS